MPKKVTENLSPKTRKAIQRRESQKKSKTSSRRGKTARTKGHSFEREVAKALRKVFPHAERRLEYQSSKVTGADLDNTGKYLIQCKNYKNYVAISKIEEVQSQAGKIPVLVTKGNRLEAMAVIPFSHFVELVEETTPEPTIEDLL